jgi:hypothetical protein
MTETVNSEFRIVIWEATACDPAAGRFAVRRPHGSRPAGGNRPNAAQLTSHNSQFSAKLHGPRAAQLLHLVDQALGRPDAQRDFGAHAQRPVLPPDVELEKHATIPPVT